MSDETTDTRQPRVDEDYAEMIRQALGATTMADAYNRVSAIAAIHPLIWARVDSGQIVVSPDLTVSGTVQLIRVLEGLKVRA